MEPTSSTINFMTAQYRSNISGENLVSKQKQAISVKYILEFKDLVQKKNN